uniref:ribosomal protein S3 n=1 Tax=Vacuolaria virescens TaxID=44451 RepID=UPI0021148C50|nr:ribosomal protein S3 [Vacuolaria virescens]UTE94636.1 ribosomal protein S3 [Vacuolaria virescens]
MGHKTHPIGFRLGILKNHHSSWFSNFKNYSSTLYEDYIIRKELLNFLNSKNIKNSGISKILINRDYKFDNIGLEIHTSYPGIIVGKSGKTLSELNNLFLKLFKNEKKIVINIFEINEPYIESALVAYSIVEQLEKRVPFKRVVKKIISLVNSKSQIQGIKVQISGRLNGAEIARSEWLREGRVPLQTLRADIDYSCKIAQTIYGILGVKVWLFKGEIFQ